VPRKGIRTRGVIWKKGGRTPSNGKDGKERTCGWNGKGNSFLKKRKVRGDSLAGEKKEPLLKKKKNLVKKVERESDHYKKRKKVSPLRQTDGKKKKDSSNGVT